MAYRVAVASSDGIVIDLHFGQADKFYIYDVLEDSSNLVEARNIDRHVAHEKNELDKAFALLHDCTAIIVSRIGYRAAEYLSKNGLRVFEAPYRVSDVLGKLSAQHILSPRQG